MGKPANNWMIRVAVYGSLILIALGVRFGPDIMKPVMDRLAMPAALDRPISYDDDVFPIFRDRCFRCHGGGKSKGGFNLNKRENFLGSGKRGPLVVAGDGAASYLTRILTTDVDGFHMPPSGSLPKEEVAIIRTWIDQDMPWFENPPDDMQQSK